MFSIWQSKSYSSASHPSCGFFSCQTLKIFPQKHHPFTCFTSHLPFFFGFFQSPLHSGVLCGHLFEAFHGFHNLVGGEGLLHLPVLVHLMDALCHCDGHLLGRHPIVLPFCLMTRNERWRHYKNYSVHFYYYVWQHIRILTFEKLEAANVWQVFFKIMTNNYFIIKIVATYLIVD